MSNVFAIVYLGVVPTITGTLFFAPVLNFFSFVIGVINFIFTDFISGSINFIISKAKGGK
jgi:Na+/proline symporter